ncbi:hypothetical protein KY362_01200, partial [Candidatus Woesearchaeota archaeon]|nr:hypothetical protein [Candidatus Woesearchaeota archaeon]
MSVDEAVERAIVPAEKGEIVDTTLENYATQIAECETETEIIKCVESIDSAITKEVRKISWEDYDADGNQLLASTGIGLGAFCKYGAAALYWLATEFPDFSAPGVLPLGLAVLGIHLAFDAGLISLAWNYFGEKEKLFEQDKKERIAEANSKRLLLASAIETMYDRE